MHQDNEVRNPLDKEAEFIDSFAKKWNEKLVDLGLGTDGVMHYVGWLNLAQMLREFLKEYKKRK